MQALAKKKKKQNFFQQPARVTGRMKIFFQLPYRKMFNKYIKTSMN